MDVGFFYVPGPYTVPVAINDPAPDELNVKVFPNPVADEFVLSYGLTQAAHVQIELYNIAGTRVTTLLSEDAEQTGKYTHGIDITGYHLAPGVYFVNFNISGRTATQKLVITE